jgi:hypothetical protein
MDVSPTRGAGKPNCQTNRQAATHKTTIQIAGKSGADARPGVSHNAIATARSRE